jgi:uncharacterized protein (TIGR02246 family)
MKATAFIPTALAVFVLTAAAFAQDKDKDKPPTAAEKTAKAAADAYVAAFNKGDVQQLAAMYAEDAQYSSDEGTARIGRAEVEKGLARFLAKNKGIKLELQIESARFLTPDVLVEKGFSTIGDETTRYVCNYVKKDGAWLISELLETKLPPLDAGTLALDEIAWMVGSWKDNSPGIDVTTSVAWTKNKHFLRRSIAVTREGENTIEATEIIGYDPIAGLLHSWVFDSEGGFGEGTWTHESNKWLESFRAVAPDGSVSTSQQVITLFDNNKYTWENINRQREGQALPNLDKIEVIRAEGQ